MNKNFSFTSARHPLGLNFLFSVKALIWVIRQRKNSYCSLIALPNHVQESIINHAALVTSICANPLVLKVSSLIPTR